ncbi:MAG: imidazole glycerol phosphate synthase subunit HisH [Candidatus Schekmanbacteria bacterium]|nr:imidazole glycerol phosphate synthase subunit HisH [Candidatus Schekmanbacteria bacterium]
MRPTSACDITILDWGSGNLGSVVRAFRRLGQEVRLESRPDMIARADRVVFPGVGAFGAVMTGIRERRLEEPLREFLRRERPFLGVCVGLQALFAASEESPGVPGLGVFPGSVLRLRARKVPHVGWNEVVPVPGNPQTVVAPGHAYFVNSYAAPAPDDADWIAARTDHEGWFASAIAVGTLVAVQFHPEKSGGYGAALLNRWISC